MTRDVCERDFSKENSHHLRKDKQWLKNPTLTIDPRRHASDEKDLSNSRRQRDAWNILFFFFLENPRYPARDFCFPRKSLLVLRKHILLLDIRCMYKKNKCLDLFDVDWLQEKVTEEANQFVWKTFALLNESQKLAHAAHENNIKIEDRSQKRHRIYNSEIYKHIYIYIFLYYFRSFSLWLILLWS